MTELKINLESPEIAAILIGVMEELRKAETKHTWHPSMGIFEKVSILSEEAGEVAKAANDRCKHELVLELKQTAAVCLRILKDIENEEET